MTLRVSAWARWPEASLGCQGGALDALAAAIMAGEHPVMALQMPAQE